MRNIYSIKFFLYCVGFYIRRWYQGQHFDAPNWNGMRNILRVGSFWGLFFSFSSFLAFIPNTWDWKRGKCLLWVVRNYINELCLNIRKKKNSNHTTLNSFEVTWGWCWHFLFFVFYFLYKIFRCNFACAWVLSGARG